MSAVRLIREVLPALKARRGAVLAITSSSVKEPWPGLMLSGVMMLRYLGWNEAADRIVRAIDKVTAVQLADQSLVDLAGSKVEHRQILVSREPGSLDLIGDRADLAFSNLCLEEL